MNKAGNQTADGSCLLQFRAGRMTMMGKMVHADTRKGLVYLTQCQDGLKHFCWKDRVTGMIEDDFILFPKEFDFKRVDQCTTGRVYVLIFKLSAQRLFYWMQEPLADKDEEYCQRVNELINKSSQQPPEEVPVGDQPGDHVTALQRAQQELLQVFASCTEAQFRTAGSRKDWDASGDGDSTTTSTPTSTPTKRRKLTRETNSKVPKFEHEISPAVMSGGDARRIAADKVARFKPKPVNSSFTFYLYFPPGATKEAEYENQKVRDTISTPPFQAALMTYMNKLKLSRGRFQFTVGREILAAVRAANVDDFIAALEKFLPTNCEPSSDYESSED